MSATAVVFVTGLLLASQAAAAQESPGASATVAAPSLSSDQTLFPAHGREPKEEALIAELAGKVLAAQGRLPLIQLKSVCRMPVVQTDPRIDPRIIAAPPPGAPKPSRMPSVGELPSCPRR